MRDLPARAPEELAPKLSLGYLAISQDNPLNQLVNL